MFSVSASLFNQTSFFSESLQSRFASRQTADQEALVGGSFSQGLKKGLGVELEDDKAVNPASSTFDVEKVVDTVMKFVDKRIQQARDNGASEEELQGMLDAARSGVETGFAQARDQITAMNQMDEKLGERIDKAERGIEKGIDKLENKLFKDTDDSLAVSLPEPAQLAQVDYARVAQRTTESFEFELTTRDGDKVSIAALNDQSFYAESMQARSGGSALDYTSFEQNSQFGFSLNVKGELDEGELLAIHDLLAQVNELAEEFYSGDLDVAFEMALTLNSDPSEIAKFSLDLKQQQSTAVEIGQYRAFAPATAGALPNGLAEPLSHFAQGVRDAFEFADTFAEPRNLLNTLFDKMDEQQRMAGLLAPLLGELGGDLS